VFQGSLTKAGVAFTDQAPDGTIQETDGPDVHAQVHYTQKIC
jgi:hypothetical protein